MISVDGMFAGPNGDISWHNVDENFNAYAIDLLNTIDTIIFGRITYKMFESYWPAELNSPKTSPNDRVIAQRIDDAKKILFSKTVEATPWKNTQLFTEINAEDIQKIKNEAGKDIVIYGSGTVVQVLANLGLIDEYRLFVAPLVLGAGRPLFEKIDNKITLSLIEAKEFANGNVVLRYGKI